MLTYIPQHKANKVVDPEIEDGQNRDSITFH